MNLFFKTKNKPSQTKAFTIVELLIVIVVIGSLAAITFVSYSGISKRALESTLSSDLTNAAKLMSIELALNDVAPTSFPLDVKVSSNVNLSLSSTGDTKIFCINGKLGDNLYMYYDSSDGLPITGNCSGSVIEDSEIGISKNIALDDSFTLLNGSNWRISLSDYSGVVLSTRTGTSSDPIINKPVLVITNNTAKSESWAVLDGPISYADIVAGKTYRYSLWVRKIGSGYTGTIGLNARDQNGQNTSLSLPNSPVITTTWQKMTGTGVATQNGFSSNNYYLFMNAGAFLSAGWSLEFQEPLLYQID